MCEIDEKSFVFELFEEIKKKIKLKKKFGEIQFGHISKGVQHSSGSVIRMALGTTYTKLKQSHDIDLSESLIMEPGMSPKQVAGIIIQMSFQLTRKIDGLKPARKLSDFGDKKIYWNVLDAILGLFLDKLAEVSSNKYFEEKMSSVEQLIRLHGIKPLKNKNSN